MRALKALSFVFGFVTIVGCQGPDEFYRLSNDGEKTGAAGSSSPGTAGSTTPGTAGTSAVGVAASACSVAQLGVVPMAPGTDDEGPMVPKLSVLAKL